MRPGKALRIVIDSAIAAGLGAAGVGITGKEGFNMTLLQNVVPVVEERFMQLLELFDGLIAPPVAPPVAPPGFFD